MMNDRSELTVNTC